MKPRLMMHRLMPWVFALVAGAAWGADGSHPDAAALALADTAPADVEQPADWRLFVEGAAGHSALGYGLSAEDFRRLSLDFVFDKKLAPQWRVVLSNRIDRQSPQNRAAMATVNSFREAYVSWQPADAGGIDLGRVNARYGTAAGYNPTDYFRDDAVRSVVSLDPISLRKNRLGSFIVRGQTLWDGGSLAATVSPRLTRSSLGAAAGTPSNESFSADWEATNKKERWLLVFSQRLSDTLSPQWLLYGQKQAKPQLGFNMSLVPTDALVSYFEWSGGRGPSLLAQATGGADDSRFRQRFALGSTYSTASKLNLTLEFQHSSAGLGRDAWNLLRSGPATASSGYLAFAERQQDLPTRHALFLHAAWRDVFVSDLDFNALLRINLEDRSRLAWMEVAYHWKRADAALQWQATHGDPRTVFGASPERRSLRVVFRFYL
jgi:hypothetical protein